MMSRHSNHFNHQNIRRYFCVMLNFHPRLSPYFVVIPGTHAPDKKAPSTASEAEGALDFPESIHTVQLLHINSAISIYKTVIV